MRWQIQLVRLDATVAMLRTGSRHVMSAALRLTIHCCNLDHKPGLFTEPRPHSYTLYHRSTASTADSIMHLCGATWINMRWISKRLWLTQINSIRIRSKVVEHRQRAGNRITDATNKSNLLLGLSRSVLFSWNCTEFYWVPGQTDMANGQTVLGAPASL